MCPRRSLRTSRSSTRSTTTESGDRTVPSEGAIMEPNQYDRAIRREVLDTLHANRAASLDTVLGNWRYHPHGVGDETETASVEAILDDERALMIKRELTGEGRSWWRFW